MVCDNAEGFGHVNYVLCTLVYIIGQLLLFSSKEDSRTHCVNSYFKLCLEVSYSHHFDSHCMH